MRSGERPICLELAHCLHRRFPASSCSPARRFRLSRPRPATSPPSPAHRPMPQLKGDPGACRSPLCLHSRSARRCPPRSPTRRAQQIARFVIQQVPAGHQSADGNVPRPPLMTAWSIRSCHTVHLHTACHRGPRAARQYPDADPVPSPDGRSAAPAQAHRPLRGPGLPPC